MKLAKTYLAMMKPRPWSLKLTDSENELMVGGGEEGIGGDFGTDMYTLLYLKWISIKDLLYGTGNSAQYSITT